jgi:hypothetical protein
MNHAIVPMPEARLARLPAHPLIWRGGDLARMSSPSVPSGFAQLDAELPGGGWPVGVLTELLPEHEGIGELRILGPALASLCARGRKLAWIAPPYLPYAPALAAAGIDPARLVIVRTRSPKEVLWAAEQALASNACGAVLAWLISPRYEELRRLQLAAENAQALAMLFRAPHSSREPSPAALRIALSTADGGLAVRIIKRRGAPLAGAVILPAMQAGIKSLARRKKASLHDVDRNSSPAAAAGKLPARIALA